MASVTNGGNSWLGSYRAHATDCGNGRALSYLFESVGPGSRRGYGRTAIRSRPALRWRRVLLSRSRPAEYVERGFPDVAAAANVRFRESRLRLGVSERRRAGAFAEPHGVFVFGGQILRR